MSEFPCRIPDAATARKFASVDDDVRAVADCNNKAIAEGIAVTEEVDLISNPDDLPKLPADPELVSKFNVIRIHGGAVDCTGLSDLNGISNREGSLVAFMT